MDEINKKISEYSPIWENIKQFAVFQVSGKTPIIKEWQKPHSCIRTKEGITHRWCTGGEFATNIGLNCGASNVFVVDIDPRNNGDDALSSLLSEFGDFPDTLISATGGGGHHFFFVMPNMPIGNIIGFRPGIDIKGIGGYVVLPPSVHMNGKPYLWENEREPADAPAWLIAEIQRHGNKIIKTGVIAKKDAYIEGSRNDTLMRLTASLLAKGLSKPAIIAAVQKENTEKCVPSLELAEVNKILSSVLNRYESQENPTVIEIDISEEISQLTSDSPKEDIKEMARRVSKLDAFDQSSLVKKLAKISGVGVSAVKREIKKFAQADEKERRQQAAREKSNVVEGALELLSELIIIPQKSTGHGEHHAAHLMIKRENGDPDYLMPFWNKNDQAAANVLREIKNVVLTKETNYLEMAIGGESEAAATSIIATVRHKIEDAVSKGRMGNVCRLSFGPFLDMQDGKFHVKTAINENVLIVQGSRHGAEIITEALEPKQDEETFALLMKRMGVQAHDCLSHVISSITNERPTSKHALLIAGSKDSGKTSLALLLAKLVENNVTSMPAGALSGSWPTFVSARTPIIDNLDNHSLNHIDADTLCQALTTRETTLPARYTASGLTAESGYPIFTSVFSDVMHFYSALESRSILIQHRYDDKIRTIALDDEKLADAVKPHIFWLVEKFVKSIISGEIPAQPGLLRQISFARARWWIAKNVQNLTDEQIDEIMRGYGLSTDEELDEDPMMQAIDAAFSYAIDKNLTLNGIKLKDIYRLMLESPADLSKVKVGKMQQALTESSSPEKAIGTCLRKTVSGGKFGKWSIIERKNSRNNKPEFVIAPLAPIDFSMGATANPRSERLAPVAPVAPLALEEIGLKSIFSIDGDEKILSGTPSPKSTGARGATGANRAEIGFAPHPSENAWGARGANRAQSDLAALKAVSSAIVSKRIEDLFIEKKKSGISPVHAESIKSELNCTIEEVIEWGKNNGVAWPGIDF